jgi:uncharacterized protein (TIGR03435 family)
MRHHAEWRMLFLATVVVVVLAITAVAVALTSPRLRAQATAVQSPTPQWQIDAGGKMAFNVASVKLNKSSDAPHANFPLDIGDSYSPTGGLLSITRFSVDVYIGFAYKLTPYEIRSLQLPKWATTDRFDIQARADGNPTKDQMRLMMQSLLADRFKLVVHSETKQLPVFALVLVKPGKTGLQLQPHPDDPHCSNEQPLPPAPRSAATPSPKVGDVIPAVCNMLLGQVISGRMEVSGRNISMGYLANYLVEVENLDRPVLDQTGLSGNFDLTMDAPDLPAPPGQIVESDPSAPTFPEILQDQLGLKLVPRTGPVDVLVIDHVEEPSPN